MKNWETIIQQKKKMLIAFEDMIVNMEPSTNISSIVTELFLRGREHNISHASILQSYFKVPKTKSKRHTLFYHENT